MKEIEGGLTINAAARVAYEIAKKNGFYDHYDGIYLEYCILRITEEVAEAHKEFKRFGKTAKLKEEFADIVINALTAATHLGIEDIESEVLRKMRVNEGRGYLHKEAK